jgi:hypothetical protein
LHHLEAQNAIVKADGAVKVCHFQMHMANAGLGMNCWHGDLLYDLRVPGAGQQRKGPARTDPVRGFHHGTVTKWRHPGCAGSYPVPDRGADAQFDDKA